MQRKLITSTLMRCFCRHINLSPTGQHFLRFFCFVEKTYWLHFFEVGSHNDLLYKLYAVMCDVFVVVVDSTNPMASQDAVLMLDKIRSLSPDNGKTSR